MPGALEGTRRHKTSRTPTPSQAWFSYRLQSSCCTCSRCMQPIRKRVAALPLAVTIFDANRCSWGELQPLLGGTAAAAEGSCSRCWGELQASARGAAVHVDWCTDRWELALWREQSVLVPLVYNHITYFQSIIIIFIPPAWA